MRKGKKTILYLSLAYILICSMAYLFQEKLIFLPTKLPQDYTYTFEFPFEEFTLTASDGAKLNALHLKSNNPKGVILYFHGNAGDLSRWAPITNLFTKLDYDVIVMDYRTYGKSTGTLSEEALYNDASLFYAYALTHYPEDEIVVYGRSLGTGLATYLAANNSPKKLLLETPYYSIADVAKKRFPIFPVKTLLKYKLPSNTYILDASCPVVIFHGTDDKVVAYDSGARLAGLVPKNQLDFVTIAGGGHNNLIAFKEYRNALLKVLE